MYSLGCTSDKIWDYNSLIQELVEKQGKDLVIKIDPEAICLRSLGLYDILDNFKFNSVAIQTHNPLEQHPHYDIQHSTLSFWADQVPQVPVVQHHIWNKSKRFMCLYGRPTAGRLGIGAYAKEHYNELSRVHYSYPVADNEFNFELDKLFEFRVESIAEIGKLLTKMPITLETTERYTAFDGYDYADPLTKYYQDIFVDLVVESHVKGKTFFPTEKVFRPMWLKKPFITFASKDFNEYLIQLGFKTFWEYWDEGYDGHEGKERFAHILALVDTLASKSIAELEDMYNSMQDVLEHNYNLLKTKRFGTSITEVV